MDNKQNIDIESEINTEPKTDTNEATNEGKWITKSYCPKDPPKPIPMPKDMEEFAVSLVKKGHTCIMYCGIDHPTLRWCEKEECDEELKWKQMHQRHKEQLDLREKLIAEGHICVSTPECYPARISWCKQPICSQANVIVMKPSIHLVPIHKIDMPEKMKKDVLSLKTFGHKCVMYDDIGIPKLSWCNKESCDNDTQWNEIMSQHKKQLELHDELIRKGHNCVYVSKNCPAHVEWCGYLECTMTYYDTMRIYYKRINDVIFS